MLRPLLAFVLVATVSVPAVAAAPLSFPLAARAREVTVIADRIVLADVSPTAPRALLDVDIGPAPKPGGKTVLSRDAVRAALVRAGAEAELADGLPARQVVRRASTDLTTDDLEVEIRNAMASRLPLGVMVTGMSGLRALTVPEGQLSIEVTPTRLRRQTRLRVTVRVDDRPVAQLSPTVRLGGDPKTPTLRNDLPRGAVVSPDDVKMESTELDRLPANVLTKRGDLVGKRLKQPGRAGKPVQRTAVMVPPLIERGATVRLVLISNGLRIARAGIAQQDGQVGDFIAVKAADGSKVIRGRIHGHGEVRVNLGGTP